MRMTIGLGLGAAAAFAAAQTSMLDDELAAMGAAFPEVADAVDHAERLVSQGASGGPAFVIVAVVPVVMMALRMAHNMLQPFADAAANKKRLNDELEIEAKRLALHGKGAAGSGDDDVTGAA